MIDREKNKDILFELFNDYLTSHDQSGDKNIRLLTKGIHIECTYNPSAFLESIKEISDLHVDAIEKLRKNNQSSNLKPSKAIALLFIILFSEINSPNFLALENKDSKNEEDFLLYKKRISLAVLLEYTHVRIMMPSSIPEDYSANFLSNQWWGSINQILNSHIQTFFENNDMNKINEIPPPHAKQFIELVAIFEHIIDLVKMLSIR